MQEGKRVLAGLACLLLLCFTAVMSVGCGKAEPVEKAEKTTEEAEEAAEEATEEAAVTEETAPKTTGGEAEEAAESEETGTSGEKSPSGTDESRFSFDVQSVGSSESTEPLTVSRVSWSDEGGYYRFVFEFRRPDGGEAGSLHFSQTYYSEDRLKLFIFFLGVDVSDSRFQDLGDSVFLGHLPVSRITRIQGPSDLETTFVLELINPLRHYLHYGTNPMRVILDVEKKT